MDSTNILRRMMIGFVLLCFLQWGWGVLGARTQLFLLIVCFVRPGSGYFVCPMGPGMRWPCAQGRERSCKLPTCWEGPRGDRGAVRPEHVSLRKSSKARKKTHTLSHAFPGNLPSGKNQTNAQRHSMDVDPSTVQNRIKTEPTQQSINRRLSLNYGRFMQ